MMIQVATTAGNSYEKCTLLLGSIHLGVIGHHCRKLQIEEARDRHGVVFKCTMVERRKRKAVRFLVDTCCGCVPPFVIVIADYQTVTIPPSGIRLRRLFERPSDIEFVAAYYDKAADQITSQFRTLHDYRGGAKR